MNKTKEKLSKIKLKYPEIREILQKLYTSAYRSGQAIKDKGDSYDHSTAYEEIEKALDSMREETLREVEEKLDGLDCGFCNYEKEVKLRLNKLKTKNEKKR